MEHKFNCIDALSIKNKELKYYSIRKLTDNYPKIAKLPFSLKILLENLLRNNTDSEEHANQIMSVINWNAAAPSGEIDFAPARVILQDFTGVPAIVDLATMREEVVAKQGKAESVNPLVPVELVIDHSVMVDEFGSKNALNRNIELEFKRNRERYRFLRWGQLAFDNFKVVPPGKGIVHQVNLENLARVVFNDGNWLYPDTLVGTDSHTTMINGLGILGWGVGGIEAEAAMLGQPSSMLLPEVVGVKLTGKLSPFITATDLVLTVVEKLRKLGVVGKFVEFFGSGCINLNVADRSTIANMAPEYGATCGIFPVDQKTIDYLQLTGRTEEEIETVKAYFSAQDMYGVPEEDPKYSEVLEIDLAEIQPSVAGPSRPQDRVLLSELKDLAKNTLPSPIQTNSLSNGSVVIAAITSCTNTSNPHVLVCAALLAKKAAELGLQVKPWVKTSFAPGSQVVTQYLENAQLLSALESLGFNVVGYGCTTCIGNSGPIPKDIAEKIEQDGLKVASVLSGNRNFEGRIHPQVKQSFLASPPLVVAYALAGTISIDLTKDPIGTDQNGAPVLLEQLWPSDREIAEIIKEFITPEIYKGIYKDIFTGDDNWEQLDIRESELFPWELRSTYIQKPNFFNNQTSSNTLNSAKALLVLGDSITTDHISPAGNIKLDSPAGSYLQQNGVAVTDFNSYGSRRGNHQVMVRGTFANIRIQNKMVPEVEGGFSKKSPEDPVMTVYDLAMQYKKQDIPLLVFAGKEYGTGSSRDWAAKGTKLLGVKAVVAESYERIHRSNLIGMGVLPLEFLPGDSCSSLGITGFESFDVDLSTLKVAGELEITMQNTVKFKVKIRLDTPKELEYYQNDGILAYMVQRLINEN